MSKPFFTALAEAMDGQYDLHITIRKNPEGTLTLSISPRVVKLGTSTINLATIPVTDRAETLDAELGEKLVQAFNTVGGKIDSAVKLLEKGVDQALTDANKAASKANPPAPKPAPVAQPGKAIANASAQSDKAKQEAKQTMDALKNPGSTTPPTRVEPTTPVAQVVQAGMFGTERVVAQAPVSRREEEKP